MVEMHFSYLRETRNFCPRLYLHLIIIVWISSAACMEV